MAKQSQLETLRGLERDLASELSRLRKVIKAAERGENKRIKDTAKYLKRRGRELERVAETRRKIQEKELEKLEKFLGESFESLSEARKEFTTQTKKPTKKEVTTYREEKLRKAKQSLEKSKTEKQHKRKAQEIRRIERELGRPTLDVNRPAYSVRQLSEYERQRVVDFLRDAPRFNQLGDGYLRPEERITVSVPYRYRGADGRMHTGHAVGKKVFKNWADLRQYILHYGEGNNEETLDDWLGSIEVMKFPTAEEYARAKDRFKDFKERTHEGAIKYYKEREKKRRKAAYEKGLKAGAKAAERKLRKEQKKGRK